MTPTQWRRWLWLLGAASLLLRLLLLGQNGLWHDEVATFNTAILPLGQIPAVAANHSNSPPLYFWLVHFVMAGAGHSESALRLLSAVAGALTVPLLALLVAELSGSLVAGVVGGIFLAFNPLHLWFSQEARAYALLTLCCAAALLALARAIRTGGAGDWAGFAVALLVGLCVNPVAGAILPVAWIWVLLSERRRLLLGPLALISGLVCVTALGIAHAIPGHEHPPEEHRGIPGVELGYTAYAYLAGYSFGPGTRELQTMGAVNALRTYWAQAGLVLVALIGWAVLILKYRPGFRWEFLALALLPPLQILAASMFSAFPFNVRYALPGLLGAMGLLAVTAAAAPRRLFTGALILGVGLSLWSDLQWFSNPRYRKDDTRGALAWLAARLPAGSIVGAVPGYMNETMEYYAVRTTPRLAIVRVAPDTGGVPVDSVAAMALTRFHLVPGWRQIEHDLATGQRIKDSTTSISGYHLFVLKSP